jgi:DHA1 family multidrug resistance protein-like MFS transporter
MPNSPDARTSLVTRLRTAARIYPRSFWALLAALFIAVLGIDIVWPLMSMYARQAFGVPLARISSVYTLYALVSGLVTTIAGAIVDRVGRKLGVLAVLVGSSIVFLGMGLNRSYNVWVGLMLGQALVWPFLQVSSHSMVADWLDHRRRTMAYGMILLSMSAGGVIGPTLGGFLMERSHALAFVVAAAIALAASLLVLVFVRESLRKGPSRDPGRKPKAAYWHVLRNKPFLAFCGVYAVHMCTIHLMTLLPVYANEQHAIREGQTGLILSVGALMPVLLQYVAVRIASRYNPLCVLTVGALFYAVAMGTIAVGTSFWAFLGGLCLLQIGLLISAPTASTITANAAPHTMRGRYMSMLSLAGWVGFGFGPLIGGLLNDCVAPVAIWYGGVVLGLAAAGGFYLLAVRSWKSPSELGVDEAAQG